MKYRVVIAEDHRLVLETLNRFLETECEIVGTATDGRTALAVVKATKPDVVLLDMALPLLNGIDVCRLIKIENPHVRVIFVTVQTGPEYVRKAFETGASGYILKQAAASEVIAAIHDVMKGRFALSSVLAHSADAVPGDTTRDPGKLFSVLTPRQREVLQLVAEGRSAKEIASMLSISTKTVEFHKKHLMEDLNLKNSNELVRYAVEQGFVHS